MSFAHAVSRNAAAVLGWLLLVCSSNCCVAQPNNTDTFVTRPAPGRGVLRLSAELQTPASSSTSLLRVSIGGTVPSKADRDLTLVYYVRSYGRGEAAGVAYHLPVRLAEGQKQIKLVLPLSQSQDHGVWDVGLFEDGRDIEDRRQTPASVGYQYIYRETNYFPLGSLVARQENPEQVKRQVNDLSLRTHNSVNQNSGSATPVTAYVLPLAEASQDWRSYYSCSAWTLSEAAWLQLQAEQPAAAAALRDYVASGGELLIHSVATDTRAATAKPMFDATSPLSKVEPVKSAPTRWWLLNSDDSDRNTDRPSATAISPQGAMHDLAILCETWLAGQFDPVRQIVEEISWAVDAPAPWLYDDVEMYRNQIMENLSSEQLIKHQYMFGEVLLSPRPLQQLPFETLQRTSFVNNHAVNKISREVDGNWFYRNLIRAVGKPPVWTFCGIVALFGAVLGPGLLILTGRMGRRSLMIFLVPTISLAATLAIVSYGILHEGFDTHLRVTSVQILDDTTQRGFAWSRQNYFSGLPPRDGLAFDPQTYARPVYSDENYRYGGNNSPRRGINYHVYLSADQTTWKGWLRPRQQQQLLIGHSIQSPQSPVRLERLSTSTVRVHNLTQDRLPMVVLRGAGDDYYFAEQLDAGEAIRLSAQDYGSVAAAVARAAVNYRPEAPPELDDGGSLLEFGASRRWRQGNTVQPVDMINGIYLQYLSDRFELAPFGYTVLATESPAVEIPLAGQSTENSHLILGAQPW